jgi:predicted AlkP superfamily phosphohydrolase/phosphomutase
LRIQLRLCASPILAVALLLAVGGCADPAAHPSAPVVVVGIDGADWEVIEWLWDQGRLPNLKAIASEGVSAPMKTIHHASPVIWTSIATSARPKRHGITGFIVATPDGEQPVSSTLRRLPALWNMVSSAQRRVAVLGWWATWPVEEINGVMVSDRPLEKLDDRVWPADILPYFLELADRAAAEPNDFGGNPAAKLRDQTMAVLARGLAAEDFDLLLVYFRGVDIVSHSDWKSFEPHAFPEIAAETVARGRERIAGVYGAVDTAIGELRRAAGRQATIMILSDHGFEARVPEKLRIVLSFDRILRRLGFLKDDGEEVDMARSFLYTLHPRDGAPTRKLRFCLQGREPGGRVRRDRRDATRARLEEALAAVSYASGAPAFSLRDPSPEERADGADLAVDVLTDGAEAPLLVSGKPAPGIIRAINRLSGTHGRHTDGIFLAAGPHIDTDSRLEEMHVLDLTPTILYAMGLPTARDFDGHARIELFSSAFRSQNPARSIASWGGSREGYGTASSVDESVLDELQALGYIE